MSSMVGDQGKSGDQNFDYMFKLLIIGNSSVGKTSFLFRYADDSFTSAFVSTVGIDFKVKTVFRNDKRVKLQIWVSTTNNFHAYNLRCGEKPILLDSNFNKKKHFYQLLLLNYGCAHLLLATEHAKFRSRALAVIPCETHINKCGPLFSEAGCLRKNFNQC